MSKIRTLSVSFFVVVCSVSACTKTAAPDNATYNTLTSYSVQNISYGNDARQNMDIYLPANRSADRTRVFVLIHGGGWSAGDKSEFTDIFNSLRSLYPDHAIININYRLGTASNPGYPKQIIDIQAALDHIAQAKYSLSRQYFLFGASAGAHLSMLYGYAFDQSRQVKAICNTVGPADLTDPAYTNNFLYAGVIASFVGNVTYAQNTVLYNEISPVKRVTATSPPTISFYGDSDPLVPSSQMGLLQNALNAKGVYNEATMYAGAGHGTWNAAQMQDNITKLTAFIDKFFK